MLGLVSSIPQPLTGSNRYTPSDSADMDLGEVGSMLELGITESFKLKKQVVVSASEAAEMILR